MPELSEDQIRRFLESYVKQGNTIYLHFKGKVICKVGESIDSEDGHTNYLYREFDLLMEGWGNILWSRPMSMFLENIPYDLIPRFRPITPAEGAKLLYPKLKQIELEQQQNSKTQ